jgi:uridine kinase
MSVSPLEMMRSVRRSTPTSRSALIAITGIDASGKGFLAETWHRELESAGHCTALINVDGWLNLPAVRFGGPDPGRHFYEHALRFSEMFEQLILPLRERRSIDLEADFAEETATAYRKHNYRFENADIILLEGIFLLKRDLRHHYDASIWVDCTYETALERALRRGQEGLPPEETARAFHTIYFPAQELHRLRDTPREAATLVFANDPRIAELTTAPKPRDDSQ